MILSLKGENLIASFEGFVPTPYNDLGNNATIGYGHLLHYGPVTAADKTKWGTITHQAGLVLLTHDAGAAELAVNANVKVRLGVLPGRAQARFDALVSFVFNVGVYAFANSYVLRLINEKGAPRDWHDVATAMLAWDHVNGAVSPGLLARRKKEGAIIISGKE